MTRADHIKEYIKEYYGVELNDQDIRHNHFTFEGCDGLACPRDCKGGNCHKCPYLNFWEQDDVWEQEDKDNLYTNENIYKELINTQELIFKIMPLIYDIHTYIKSIDENIEVMKGDQNNES